MTEPKVDKKTMIGGVGLLDADALRETNAWAKRDRRAPAVSLVGQTVGSYRITRVLGEGGVGIVYLGEHPRVGSRVAIKVLHEDFLDSSEMVARFVQEAKAANAIASPHIVRVSDFGTLADGRDYAVMEYLEGRSLDAVLSESRTLKVARVVELMSQIAETMVAAHSANIVHRDLKPENLFLESRKDGSDFVRILDFGIAKLADNEDTARTTAAGAVLGTPIYCAPEQANGTIVDFRADIYALGAVAYELLTGRTVFKGNVVEVLVAKMTREAPPLDVPNVPQALEELILQMLEREASRRPLSMSEVLERLAPLREGRLSSAPTTLIVHDVARDEEDSIDTASFLPRRLSRANAKQIVPAALVLMAIVAMLARSFFASPTTSSASVAAPTASIDRPALVPTAVTPTASTEREIVEPPATTTSATSPLQTPAQAKAPAQARATAAKPSSTRPVVPAAPKAATPKGDLVDPFQ